MANFEQILNREFRWPTKGDRVIAQGAERSRDAWISPADRQRFVLMTDGYKKAGDALVLRVQTHPAERDFLVYPIVFTYRHFIELSLKYIIATYGRHAFVEANWKSHDLAVLWAAFRKVLAAFQASDDADHVVESCVLEFSEIDPASFSFRYPTDRKGDTVAIAFESIDLEQLSDVMKGLQGYFDGVDGFIASLVAA